MVYAGLDLSRKRLDFQLLDAEGAMVERGASPPDADGLQHLAHGSLVMASRSAPRSSR